MFSDFRFGHLGYWVAILIVAVMSTGLYVMTRQLQQAWQGEEATTAALQALTEFSEGAIEAESAQRGWIISRTADMRADRDRAMASASAALHRLGRLVADDGPHAQRVDRLEALLRDQRDNWQRGDDLRRFGGLPVPVRAANAAAAREVMGHLQAKRDEMRALLAARLADERYAERVATKQADQVLLFGGALIVLVFLPVYFGFTREAWARRNAEALLRDLTENLPGAVFSLRRFRDGRARLEFVSGNVERVRGVTRDDALHDIENLMRTIHPADRDGVTEILSRAAESAVPVRFDFRLREPPERWIQTSAQPRMQQDGSVLWHGHWEDITETRRLQAELLEARDRAEAASRAKSRFLAAMSHEIRTPMTGIVGMVELLARSRLDPEQRASVAVVRDSSEALLRIIDDILDFSKMEAGKLELRLQPASVGALVTRVARLYGAVASGKGVGLDCAIDPRLEAAYAIDAVRLQQVLGNLLSNAIKFTDHGEVLLGAALDHAGPETHVVRFTVRDTGVGIAPEDQARLFEPFAQASNVGQAGGGTGLGLVISRRLAQLMDGSLSVESEPGKGTLATFCVPLRPVAGEDAARLATGRDLRIVRRAPSTSRVLVVDDHPINRLVLDRQVTTLGYVAETAEHGIVALQRLRERHFDAVLVDCQMPGMDGYELARRIRVRQLAGEARTAVIACSASVLPEDRDRCLAAGMDDFIAKPVQLDALQDMLERWVP